MDGYNQQSPEGDDDREPMNTAAEITIGVFSVCMAIMVLYVAIRAMFVWLIGV